MKPADFDGALRALLEEHAHSNDNPGCIACTDCRSCVECSFCRGCAGLTRSTYCVQVQRSFSCHHCRVSEGLLSCTHCSGCFRCIKSSYLTRCVDCTSCTYCFGCVGLSGRDFHILNQPYERKAYFEEVTRLTRSLGAEGPHILEPLIRAADNVRR